MLVTPMGLWPLYSHLRMLSQPPQFKDTKLTLYWDTVSQRDYQNKKFFHKRGGDSCHLHLEPLQKKKSLLLKQNRNSPRNRTRTHPDPSFIFCKSNNVFSSCQPSVEHVPPHLCCLNYSHGGGMSTRVRGVSWWPQRPTSHWTIASTQERKQTKTWHETLQNANLCEELLEVGGCWERERQDCFRAVALGNYPCSSGWPYIHVHTGSSD